MSIDHHHPDKGRMRLILVSQSPRRSALLREHGYAVEAVAPGLPEPDPTGRSLPPQQQAEAMAYFKARSVVDRFDHGILVAGDTIVALGDHVFGKPVDRDDARRMLKALAGTTQQVITGIVLLDACSGDRLIRHDTTAVTMRAVSDEELEAYLDTDAWTGKAGAYGIQDRGDAFVERIEGSFTNVVGLPMELLARMLAQFGWQGPATAPNPGTGATGRRRSP